MALHPACVAPHLIDGFWPKVKSFIDMAFINGRGDDNSDIVHRDLKKRKAELWLVWDDEANCVVCVVTTKLVKTSRGLICLITSCAGNNARDWIRFLPLIEDYAKKEGCRYLRMSGRRGWATYLKGWNEPWVTLEKDLGA